jgi:hypothetical protein
MKKQIYKWIFFKLMGWKIVGTIDSDIKMRDGYALILVLMILPRYFHKRNNWFRNEFCG